MKIKKEMSKMPEQFKIDILKSHQEKKLSDYQYYQLEGNPESDDAVVARNSDVFVADKLPDLGKKQLNSRKVEWVELRNKDWYKRFSKVLKNLGIPYTDFKGDANNKLDEIFNEIF